MKTAIIDWVENGGGIFAIHATIDGAEGEWDWLLDNCLYGHYIPHSEISQKEVIIDTAAYDQDNNIHPILKGIEVFNGMGSLEIDLSAGTINGLQDEWFFFSNYFEDALNLNLLLKVERDYYSSYDFDNPIYWITEPVGQGKTAYSIFGHGLEIHECTLNEYKNNAGAGCNPLLKFLWKKTILYLANTLDTASVNIQEPPITYSQISNSKQVKVYDITGKLLKYSPTKGHFSNMTQGLYLIKTESENGSFYRKVPVIK